MENPAPTDSEEDAHLRHSKCGLKLSATLLNHPEQATLPSQQQAIKMFCTTEAARHATERQITLKEDATNHISSPTTSPSHSNSPVVPSETDTTVLLVLSGPKQRRAYISDEEEESNGEHEDAHTNPKPPGTLLSLQVVIADMKPQPQRHVHQLGHLNQNLSTEAVFWLT
jgi:hypothetical protein